MATKRCACYTKGRRPRGEGGLGVYTTEAGDRHWAKWQEVQPDGATRQRMKRGFESHKAASDFLASVRTDMKRGSYIAPDRTTVADLGARWERLTLAGPISEGSKVIYSRNLHRHILPAIGARAVATLRPSDIRGLYNDLRASGLSAGSLASIHTVVKQVCDLAVEDRLIPTSPATGARKAIGAAVHKDLSVWTPQQVAAFLADRREHGDTNTDLWAFLAGTGTRRGEALGLLWRDVDLEGATARIAASYGPHGRGTTKTGTGRTVDLGRGLVRILTARRELWGGRATALVDPGAPVFGDTEGAFLRPGTVSMQWGAAVADAAKRLELPKIRMHDLRHTHASILIANGLSLPAAAQRLGHAKTSMTADHYSHALPGSGAAAAELFETLLEGGE